MLNWFARKLKEVQEKDNEKGFTLIELLVVVIIIGILAAIAIPTFLSQRTKAQDSAAQSDVRNLAAAATSFAADKNGSYSGMTLKTLTDDPYQANISDSVTGHTVSPAADGKTYTVTAKSTSGKTATFNSDDGKVTLS